jgi:predicted DNA-binding WGR domain protein
VIVYLRSEDPAHNRHRYYLVSVQRDLWGGLVVVKQWGRIGAPGWQGGRSVEVPGPLEGAKVVQETLKRRRQHRYGVVREV